MQRLQRTYKICSCFLISGILSCTIAASIIYGNPDHEKAFQQLHHKIDAALKTSVLKDALVGVQIVSLESGEIVYERNPDLTLNPASNTKLITSAAALIELTPQFRFQTRVYTKARVSKGTLQGDLYLKGRGDPLLSYEALLTLAQDVYNSGIKRISGNIIGDDSYFDEEREFSGWHDFKQAYSGKISALSLNKNSLQLQIKPARRSGVAPEVILNPPTSYVKVKNKAVTLSANKVYASFLPTKEEKPKEETLVVQGKISRKSRYRVSASIHVKNPTLFATTAFKDALEQMGVQVDGEAETTSRLPEKSRRIATHYSEPLSAIICESNKSSDNFVAEQLLKTLGAQKIGAPGTTEKGLQVVQKFLAELQIPPEAYVLENGSGLSRNNRLSPEQIVTLLSYMYENFEVRSEYLASLAIAGVDGTLHRRLKDTQAERRLRAKTGAINKVSCLSGYAASRENEIFAFSIMMNGYRSGGYDIKKIQNKIGLLLTEFYRNPLKVNVQNDTDPSRSN